MTKQILKSYKLYAILTASSLVLSGFFFAPDLQKLIPQVSAQVSSFFDVFIELDSVPGSSSDPRHPNTIEVMSWSFGASNPTPIKNGSGLGSGKVSYQDISIMKRIDKASPKLYSLAKSKNKVKSMTLFVSNGEREYLKIEMADVMVSSYGLSGQGKDMPTESVSFNFSKIIINYMPNNGTAGN